MNFLNMIKAGMNPNSMGGSILTGMGATGVGGMPGQDMMGNRKPQPQGMGQMSAADMEIMQRQQGGSPHGGGQMPAYTPPAAPDMTQAGMAGGQPGGPHEMKKGGLLDFIKMMAGGG